MITAYVCNKKFTQFYEKICYYKIVINQKGRKNMKFLKNNICTILAMTFAISLAMTGSALAQETTGGTGDSVFEVAINKLSNLFKNTKSVLFIIGGFGLVALAFQAIFGKLKWAWFAALALGLAVVAAAGKVVDYAATGTDSSAGIKPDASLYEDSY